MFTLSVGCYYEEMIVVVILGSGVFYNIGGRPENYRGFQMWPPTLPKVHTITAYVNTPKMLALLYFLQHITMHTEEVGV